MNFALSDANSNDLIMNKAHSFDKIPLLQIAFPRLEDAELQEIADLTELCTYPSGHILCQEGAYEHIFYIIADGQIEISKTIGEEEGERILRLGGKGDLVGEWHSHPENNPKPSHIDIKSWRRVVAYTEKPMVFIIVGFQSNFTAIISPGSEDIKEV